jgi:hypothetical protein
MPSEFDLEQTIGQMLKSVRAENVTAKDFLAALGSALRGPASTHVSGEFAVTSAHTVYLADTSNGPANGMLPVAPADNQICTFKDATGTASQFRIAVHGAGHEIVGRPIWVIDDDRGFGTLLWSATNGMWLVIRRSVRRNVGCRLT